jgi:LysM repeat protein
MFMKRISLLLTILLLLGSIVACAGQTVEVPVTRQVISEATVEVTRVVEQIVTVEVPVEVAVEVPVEVEVTRVVEVEVVATPTLSTSITDTITTTADADSSSIQGTVTPTATGTITNNIYTVLPGDSFSLISGKTGVRAAEIRAANNFTATTRLRAGAQLIIPNWDGVIRENIVTVTPTPRGSGGVPVGTNLLPNPSFEDDWYFANYSELQIPIGWKVATDEGENTLQPGAGGLFNRPEIRVVPSSDLPDNERRQFIFEGNKTLKAFKGHAPTSFSLFTDVPLQPGRYRFTMNFFADTVAQYAPTKVYSEDPQASEARIIVDNGGTDWRGFVGGQQHTMTYEFTVDRARTVRVGGSFRNRYGIPNNGWFLDNWSLTKIQ